MPSFVERISASAVAASDDLSRVTKLARRPILEIPSIRAEALVELMTSRLRRSDRPAGAPCGCRELGRHQCLSRLLPSQAWTLFEAGIAGGILGALGAGSGKTLAGILAPMVLKSQVTALLLPPGLVGQLFLEYLAAAEHFVVPSLIMPDGTGHVVAGRPRLHLVPYSKFSRPESTALLEKLNPELIIADECHLLKSRRAARTIRVLRYFAAHPETRLCAWSGTITSKSLDDFAHLAAFALGEGSPVPLDPNEVLKWAAAVDPSEWPAPAGALKAFCAPGQGVREALHKRIAETRGVVSTKATALPGCSITLRERPIILPTPLRSLISDVRETMTRPDGEEFLTALEVSACVEQLTCGFYYRWRFPDRPERAAVDAWFAARKAWGREMRERLKRPAPHMDSPHLLSRAAERAVSNYRCGHTCRGERCPLEAHLPTWETEFWVAWRDIKDTIRHETEVIWIDDYMARDASEWALKHTGVVWYSHRALGAKIAEISGLPQHAGGPQAEARILAEKGDRSIIASVDSHGTGRDGLQRVFDTQLITVPMPSGGEFEQLLARLHRIGQESDEVVTLLYRHTSEFKQSIDRALTLAKYIEGLTSNSQRLLFANMEW